eukprot:CAMPEP_0202464256 /NCGR_PEP_ID=MMETSP1360-20130828/61381_1 /ASSEMBLY_ACC=CAM_ASM_000848 /TAXON_ID=515479 /ORGANISM="Licmophora paradoxa, Strain CCMP2313" /LENGTH=65 /DNA_ID=CAMNT_0049087501 /DNA_START=632 /DNA_END=829 /DNA_ORIENTATION=-
MDDGGWLATGTGENGSRDQVSVITDFPMLCPCYQQQFITTKDLEGVDNADEEAGINAQNEPNQAI